MKVAIPANLVLAFVNTTTFYLDGFGDVRIQHDSEKHHFTARANIRDIRDPWLVQAGALEGRVRLG
jgi:hypothetical protein